MSAAKHTPGPWEVHRGGGLVRRDNGDDTCCSIAEICVPYRHGIGHVRGDSEQQANARLIAAAPALLKALEDIMEWEEEIRADLRLHTSPGLVLDPARAAIAAARGES